MSFGTLTGILLGIFFLIPGFLWKKTAQLFSPYKATKKVELLDCLALSCLNYLLAAIPIYFLLWNWPADLDLSKAPAQAISNHPWFVAFWLGLIFFLPLLCGVLFTKLSGYQRFKDSLGKLGILTLHPAPTAWDYAFARKERYWARITLANDDIVEGLFDTNSIASSETRDRDIFLETIFVYNDEIERYEIVPKNRGMWVNPSQIKIITFFTTDESLAGNIELNQARKDGIIKREKRLAKAKS